MKVYLYLHAAYRVRVFVRVFVGVFVWVGFCITGFNLRRIAQHWIDLSNLIKHRSASQIYPGEHTIPDLHMRKYEWWWMNVCDEWMWCGVDVVCVKGARGGRGYARHGIGVW